MLVLFDDYSNFFPVESDYILHAQQRFLFQLYYYVHCYRVSYMDLLESKLSCVITCPCFLMSETFPSQLYTPKYFEIWEKKFLIFQIATSWLLSGQSMQDTTLYLYGFLLHASLNFKEFISPSHICLIYYALHNIWTKYWVLLQKYFKFFCILNIYY